MGDTFIDAVTRRRSYYRLEDRALVDDRHLVELIDRLLMVMPTPFNVQSSRVVLLLGDHHRELWHIVAETLRKFVPEERFAATKQRIDDSFASGHGTLLFYEDSAALNALREQYPLYADRVDTWSEQSSAMLQFALWTGIETMGYGASLQHYNPIIDKSVEERWQIDRRWYLKAQMPFGAPLDTPVPRTSPIPPHGRRMVFDSMMTNSCI